MYPESGKKMLPRVLEIWVSYTTLKNLQMKMEFRHVLNLIIFSKIEKLGSPGSSSHTIRKYHLSCSILDRLILISRVGQIAYKLRVYFVPCPWAVSVKVRIYRIETTATARDRYWKSYIPFGDSQESHTYAYMI